MSWFVGPIGAYIPDSKTDFVYSAAASAGAWVGTRIALNLATIHEIPRMASHHYVGSRTAIRAAARRQVGKWTVARGMGLALGASPVGWAITVATILYSIPPSVRDPVTGMTSYETYLASDPAKGN